MRTLFLIPLLMFGCVGETGVTATTTEPVTCATMTGKYNFHMVKTDGDCQDIKDSTINFDYIGMTDCEVITLNLSDNNCHGHYILSCPFATEINTDFDLQADQSVDANSASGVLSEIAIDRTSNTYYCKSNYQTTITRLP